MSKPVREILNCRGIKAQNQPWPRIGQGVGHRSSSDYLQVRMMKLQGSAHSRVNKAIQTGI
jgi:hypothetical protein